MTMPSLGLRTAPGNVATRLHAIPTVTYRCMHAAIRRTSRGRPAESTDGGHVGNLHHMKDPLPKLQGPMSDSDVCKHRCGCTCCAEPPDTHKQAVSTRVSVQPQPMLPAAGSAPK